MIEIDIDRHYRVSGRALADVFRYLGTQPWVEVAEAIPAFYEAIELLEETNDGDTDSDD